MSTSGYIGDRSTFASDLGTPSIASPIGYRLGSWSRLAQGGNELTTAGSISYGSASSTSAIATSIIDNAGNSASTALNLGSLNHIQAVNYQDWVGITDSTDYYALNLVGQSNFNLSLNESTGNVALELINSEGLVISSSNQPGISSEKITLSGLQAGQYYVRVTSVQADTYYGLNLLTEYTRIDGTVERRGFFPWQRDTEPVNLRIPDGSLRQRVENTETWIVIHGHRSAPDGFIGELATAINQNHQVLVLDWSEPADNPLIRPDLSAGWIREVAEFAAQTLSTIWGITTSNINLVGHSLGSYVAQKSATFLQVHNAKTPQVNQIIALDPATWITDAGFDIDGSESGFQAAADFYAVSTFSRAFWGKGNPISGGEGLGSDRYAHSADQSYRIEFVTSDDANTNHNNIVKLFTNFISNPTNPINQLFQLNPVQRSFWQAFDGDEGFLLVDAQNQAIAFNNI